MAEQMETEPILEKIKDALTDAGEKVYYGTAFDIGPKDPWNYTVYSRGTIDQNANHTSLTGNYVVAVTRENFVPDVLWVKIVKAVEAIPGVRLSGGIEFAYVTKPGTDRAVEQVIMTFAKAAKK